MLMPQKSIRIACDKVLLFALCLIVLVPTSKSTYMYICAISTIVACSVPLPPSNYMFSISCIVTMGVEMEENVQ